MTERFKPRSAVRQSALLSTESAIEFETRCSNFRDDLRPQNALEKMYADEIAKYDLEIARLNRFKVGIFNTNLRNALYEVFVKKLGELDEVQGSTEYLDGWFTEAEVKKELSGILAKYNLDESAIEAEAFRQSSPDWMLINQLLTVAESCRDRALRQFIFCRETLTQRLETKVIDVARDKNIPRLESKREVRS